MYVSQLSLAASASKESKGGTGLLEQEVGRNTAHAITDIFDWLMSEHTRHSYARCLPSAAKKRVAKAEVIICTPLPICTQSEVAFFGGRNTSPETIFQPLSSVSLPVRHRYMLRQGD